jgi:hypothetical protein
MLLEGTVSLSRYARGMARIVATRPKEVLTRRELMPRLVGFDRFAALLEEQISEKINPPHFSSATRGMIVW